jgi:predicted Zn-dependent protease
VDFESAFASVRAALITHPRTVITLTLASERNKPLNDPGCAHQPHVDQFHLVIQTLFEMREVRSLTEAEMHDDDELVASIQYVTVLDDIDVKQGPGPDQGVTPAMEYEIGTLPGSNWTRRQLRKLPCWPR